MISLIKFSVSLDCYYKLQAFSFRALVLKTYPVIKFQKAKVKNGFIKVTILIPYIVMKTLTFGSKLLSGLYYEKHLLKEN